MNKAKNPLTALAHEADGLVFPPLANEPAGADFSNKRKCCTYQIAGNRMVVQMLFGNQLCVLGIFKGGMLEVVNRAARFADLLIVYFWKYRKEKPITDFDLNYSLGVAQNDLIVVPGAKQLILKIESALIDLGLHSYESEKRQLRLSIPVDGHLYLLRKEWYVFSRMAVFRLKTVSEKIPEKKVTIDTALDHFDALNKCIASLYKK